MWTGQTLTTAQCVGDQAQSAVNRLRPDWSIIVIARDEEALIGDCLQSVLEAFDGYHYELIVVDSASTDQTREIVKAFAAELICLPPTAPLRPSVGRHIGLQYASGRWVLFLDGDSKFHGNWIPHAEVALQSEPRLGGIAGELEHVFLRQETTERTFNAYPECDYTKADHLEGSAAYRREALVQAGGFNPYLHSLEESELGGRIRKQGFYLRRLRIPMTEHYPKHADDSLAELFRRIRRGYYLGSGQFVRHVYKNRLNYTLAEHRPIRIIDRSMQFFALLCLGVVAATGAVLMAAPGVFFAWLGLMLAVFAIFAIKAKSIRKPAFYFFEWAVTSPLIIWGFLKSPRSCAEFPADIGQLRLSRQDETGQALR